MCILRSPTVPQESRAYEAKAHNEGWETVFWFHFSSFGETSQDSIGYEAEGNSSDCLTETHDKVCEADVGFADAELVFEDLSHGCEEEVDCAVDDGCGD
jgi:hypothetical protein